MYLYSGGGPDLRGEKHFAGPFPPPGSRYPGASHAGPGSEKAARGHTRGHAEQLRSRARARPQGHCDPARPRVHELPNAVSDRGYRRPDGRNGPGLWELRIISLSRA